MGTRERKQRLEKVMEAPEVAELTAQIDAIIASPERRRLAKMMVVGGVLLSAGMVSTLIQMVRVEEPNLIWIIPIMGVIIMGAMIIMQPIFAIDKQSGLLDLKKERTRVIVRLVRRVSEGDERERVT